MDFEQHADAVVGVASHLLQASFDVPEDWTVDDQQICERLDAVLEGKLRAPVRKKAIALKTRFEALQGIGQLEREIIEASRRGG